MRTASKASCLGTDSEISPVWIKKPHAGFDPAAFLARAGAGKTVVNLKKNDTVFSQGDPADTVFYIHKGQVQLAVISSNGKEAIICQLGAGDFIGEECIMPDHLTRMATAAALTECAVLRIDRKEMMQVLHNEPAFSGLFVSYLLAHSTRLEAELVE
jgi:CRP/FNR family cyclic AMP-dependent transcriptional regulator